MQMITCPNGVELAIIPVIKGTDIAIQVYIKMKTSGDLKLHYTLTLCQPNPDQTLTIEEYRRLGEE